MSDDNKRDDQENQKNQSDHLESLEQLEEAEKFDHQDNQKDASEKSLEGRQDDQENRENTEEVKEAKEAKEVKDAEGVKETEKEENPLDALEDGEDSLASGLGGKSAKAAANNQQKKRNRLGTAALVIVAVFVVIYLFSGSKKSQAPEQKDQTQNNSYGLEQTQDANARMLATLGEKQKQLIKYVGTDKSPQQTEAKAPRDDADARALAREKALKAKEIQVRMNAPMQMNFQVQKLTAEQQKALAAKSGDKAPVSGLSSGSAGSDFANSQSTQYSSVKAEKLAHPDYTVLQGEFLHAVLTTAIDNELAGMIEATITRPVYSYTGARILLPVGSRLVGQFRAGGGNAASTRIFAIWNRAITPDGISVMINSGSTDELGRSGQAADYIDSHFFKMFGTAAIISLIGASASVGGGGGNLYPTTEDQYRQAITQSFGQVSNKVLAKNINLTPTMYVDQGTKINVFVAHDLDFYGLIGG